MHQPLDDERTGRRNYALCVGIGTYTHLINRNLRYAVADATVIAERLADPQRGNFAITVLTDPVQTTKAALEEAVKHLLSAPDRRAEDLTLLYFSCHGDINQIDHTFGLLPSNASLQDEGMFEPTTLIGIYDFARWFESAKAQNIVVLLDVCHSGGAGAALQLFTLNLDAGPNFFFIGAARSDQVTMQSSKLQHGLFTHCLLRAFEQPPTSDGWLTISQIHAFVSDEIPWFAKEQPTQIQSWSVSVDPNLPLLRNPQYPELCPLPPLWNVPLPRNIFFTGQEVLLSRLASMLQREQKTALTQPHALSGLGGIGKTQLALEYAYRHRQDYHAILWGRADTSEALISTFMSIARLLDLPERDEPDQTVIVEAVKTWLRNRAQWLFILDNADDLALVKEFLPPAFRGHLLLTTRAQVMGKVVGSKLEVETMQPEIGALLLLRRAGMLAKETLLEEALEEDVAGAKKLAEQLGGLPLALDQAGAYIEETKCGLAGYQHRYQTRRAELLQYRGGVVDDHPDAVATTWSLSFEQVEQRNPAAADLLRLCAFLAPDAIPEEILAKGAGELGEVLAPVAADAYQLDQAIRTLRAYSLISRDLQAQALIVHRLVQAVQKDRMEPEIQHQWAERVIRAVNKAFPDNPEDIATWSQCLRYLDQTQVCHALIEYYGLQLTEGAYLLNRTGTYLRQNASYVIAESLYQCALSIYEQQLGPDHSDTAQNLNDLGVLYEKQDKYNQAETLLERALTIREKTLGPEHPITSNSFHDLAGLYESQGKYKQAELFYQKALAIREKMLGSEHPDTATSLDNLGWLYDSQGKYEQAEVLLRRALAIREKMLGPEHPDTAASLNDLAGVYDSQGKYEQAEVLLQQALAIREKMLGPEHPDTATSLNNLARLYTYRDEYEQAEVLLQRALAIDTKIYGSEHSDLAIDLNNLARLYTKQGRYEQAELLYQRAISIREQQLGVEHPETAISLYGLARLYHLQRRYREAEPLYQRVLLVPEQQLGADYPNTYEVRAHYTNLLRIIEDEGNTNM